MSNLVKVINLSEEDKVALEKILCIADKLDITAPQSGCVSTSTIREALKMP